MQPLYFENVKNYKMIDLQTCVEQYRETRNSNLITIILYKLKKTITYFLYTRYNYCDKEAMLAVCEDKLLECLDTYEVERDVLFLTFYSRCLENSLKSYFKDVLKDMNTLSLDFEYGEDGESKSLYNMLVIEEDASIGDIETKLFLDDIKFDLDENEYKLCELLVAESHLLKYSDMAKILDMTPAGVAGIIKRLQKKFIAFYNKNN